MTTTEFIALLTELGFVPHQKKRKYNNTYQTKYRLPNMSIEIGEYAEPAFYAYAKCGDVWLRVGYGAINNTAEADIRTFVALYADGTATRTTKQLAAEPGNRPTVWV